MTTYPTKKCVIFVYDIKQKALNQLFKHLLWTG